MMKRARVDSIARSRPRRILQCSLLVSVCFCLFLVACEGGYPYRQARPPVDDSLEYRIPKRSLKGKGYSSKSKSGDYYYHENKYDPPHNIFSRPQDSGKGKGKGGFWGGSKSKKYWYTPMPSQSVEPSSEPSSSQQPSAQPSLFPSPEPTTSQQPTIACSSKSSKSGKGKGKGGKKYNECRTSKKSSKKKGKGRNGSVSRKTRHPTIAPTPVPAGPTSAPTNNPTDFPTNAPTRTPTREPTEPPTRLPTRSPTRSPTVAPVLPPTSNPTQSPVTSPTMAPVTAPTVTPTTAPVVVTMTPTMGPISVTQSPTLAPIDLTDTPTQAPIAVTDTPTQSPVANTEAPIQAPTASPTTTEQTDSPTLLAPTVAPSPQDDMEDTDTPTAMSETTAPVTGAPTTQSTSPPTPPAATTLVPTMTMTTAPVGESPTESPAGTGVPTMGSPEPPTSAPIVTVVPTASPTSVPTRGPNMFRVDLTPWALTYETTSTLDPLEQDFEAAEALTLGYLEEFMRSTFEFVPDATFEDLLGSATGVALFPSRIGYETSVQFSESSTYVPTETEMEQLLAIAFEQPNVDALYMILSTLPSTNPFSTTTNVIFASAETSREAATDPLRPETIATISGICFLSVLLVTMLSLRVRRQGAQRFQYKRAPRKVPPDPYFTDFFHQLAKTCSDMSPSDGGLEERETEEIEVAFYTSGEREHETRMVPYDPLLRKPEAER